MEEAGGGNRGDSTGTVTSSQRLGSRSFSETTLTKGRRGQVGVRGRGLSPWKHPPWSITSRVGQSTRGQKEQQTMAGPVFNTSSVGFFSLFFKIFFSLIAGFLGRLLYFFGHYSHQQAWSTVTQEIKNVYVSSVKMPLTKKSKIKQKERKRHCIFTSRSFGATRLFFFFWQSSQSSYMSVSRLSFLVICDMISDFLIPLGSDLKTGV